MTFAGKRSEVIRKLRRKLTEILQSDTDAVLDELDTLLLITQEEYFKLCEISCPEKRVRSVLNTVLHKGEAACEKFLESLENLRRSFPDLGHLLEGSGDGEGSMDVEKEDVRTEEMEERGSVDVENKDVPMEESEERGASQLTNHAESPEEKTTFGEFLSSVKMDAYRMQKLSLSNVLEIGEENASVSNLKALEEVPWHVLRKIMALNVTARNTSFGNQSIDDEAALAQNEPLSENSNIFYRKANGSQKSINPLDALCVLFYCSDSFLQQEIMLKMSMCQFALPFLQPACDDPNGTFMLWAMRDIVRKWRPHSLTDSKGFREESLVLTPMPTISFVRLGNFSLSKSKFLNEVLSPCQQHHDYFIHRDMESGNVPRKIADGLVEISWYFPSGRENSDLFPEPIAITNLRGDIESHWLQFIFLSEISSAVFIFVDHISEREYTLLLSLKQSKAKYYFILNSQTSDPTETLEFLNKLAPVMNLNRSCLLEKDKTTNEAEFVKKLQSVMLGNTLDPALFISVENMAATARKLEIRVDEDCKECRRAAVRAIEITKGIKNIVDYKKKMMTLQGDLLKRLAKAEKECCRMKRQGDTPPEVYKCQLRDEITELRRQQNKCNLTDSMIKFIAGIRQPSKVAKQYFLKWLKFNLDNIARENLSKLRAEYKELFSTLGDDPTQLTELDRKISESSLGLEHFMRELGQFYEAEHSMIKNENRRRNEKKFSHLPSIAADLLLEGFPLELIDGDVSNIPLQWITNVLAELNTKLAGRSQMIVLTVLGVQSTGKSTLLNTMFGLQFSVSSGRCTRGAFMLLIKVKDNLKKDLGCDFILVIDTEGLKAPELSMLDDSYEHDNELATLVIGLSDITVVNIAMENATEMKDILQIVVHAFLRMEEIGQSPNCQFVHQNVSDVSAHDQNMRDRQHLFEHLNEMTKTAAKMEKQSRDITFSDIMEYDPEKHNWYIPGLWHGIPPMAPVNRGYSENVHELKRYLFEYIRTRSKSRDSKDIGKFMEWVKSLWNAVKHENFIFSFRNSLVADAYNQLCIKYSDWEWSFRKEMHLWASKAETVVHNLTSSEPDFKTYNALKQEALQKLQTGKQNILNSLQKYFDSGAQNLHLVEKYREDFNRSTKSLKDELESYVFSKLEEAIRIHKSRHKIDTLQGKYMKEIESKVVSLLEDCRNRNCELREEELSREFGIMWKKTLIGLHLNKLELRQISQDMQCHLMKDLSSIGSFANQLLQNVQSLLTCGEIDFRIKQNHFDLPWYSVKRVKERFTHECERKATELCQALIVRCASYVEGKASSNVDYDGTYCRELLHLISEFLHSEEYEKLPTTPHLEVDLKLHILGRAACVFQKMHEDFVQKNDPQSRLEKCKSRYLSTFIDLYLKKDECQKRAKSFSDECLRPALEDHIERRLGFEVVEDILHHGHSIKYSCRTYFQFDVLQKLLLGNSFNGFSKYISEYEHFVKDHIFKHILDHCSQTGILKKLVTNILSTITKQIREVIDGVRGKKCKNVQSFLDLFCQTLRNGLVISKASLELILFQNTANVEQFSENIEFFLTELEEDILAESEEYDIVDKLSYLPYKPQDELFKKVFGCAKQCPFCKAPCEAGGKEHKEHFASIHRPQGLGGCRYDCRDDLVFSLCSTDVVSNARFRNVDTRGQWHPYKDYRVYYPDWCIQPDASIEASDYWKFVFVQFNKHFAHFYHALPANLPPNWSQITSKQALKSVKEVFNMGEK